jgi:hypothetical protein
MQQPECSTESLLIIDKHDRIAGIKDEEVNGKRLIVRKYKMIHMQEILTVAKSHAVLRKKKI